MTIYEFYYSIHVDPAHIFSHFVDEAQVKKYLKKLTIDPTFSHLEEKLAAGLFHEAFWDAHNLKGLALTLSLEPLIEPLGTLVDLLLAPTPDGEAIRQAQAQAKAIYQLLLVRLKQLV